MVSLPFNLSPGFVPHVAVGDTIKVGTLLASRPVTGGKISLSEILNLKPHQVAKTLKVSPGESIAKGDVLAEKKSLLNSQKVYSEVNGTVAGFERDNGELSIKREGNDEVGEEIKSPVEGVVSLCNNDQIVIDTEKNILLGSKGTGGSSTGELVTVETPGDNSSSPLFALDSSIIGKILYLKDCDRDMLLKAIGMGVEGLISTTIGDSDMGYLLERNIATPVILVDQDSGKKLRSWLGKSVHLDGRGKAIVLLHL